jgi:hypothetical protein
MKVTRTSLRVLLKRASLQTMMMRWFRALRALMTWLWLRRATRRLRLPTAGAGMAAGNAAAG